MTVYFHFGVLQFKFVYINSACVNLVGKMHVKELFVFKLAVFNMSRKLMCLFHDHIVVLSIGYGIFVNFSVMYFRTNKNLLSFSIQTVQHSLS